MNKAVGTAASRTAVLLIAHGSRRVEANDDLPRLAEMLRQRDVVDIVEIAFLELVEPTIPQGARRCVERAARQVVLLPYFLSAGAHVSEDLQRFQAELTAEFPGVEFRLRLPLGIDSRIVDVLVDRLKGQ